MATTIVTICVDSDVKKQCEELYDTLELDLNAAINVFLHKSLLVGGFPFTEPNDVTLAAMKEAEQLGLSPSTKRWGNVEYMLEALKK